MEISSSFMTFSEYMNFKDESFSAFTFDPDKIQKFFKSDIVLISGQLIYFPHPFGAMFTKVLLPPVHMLVSFVCGVSRLDCVFYFKIGHS